MEAAPYRQLAARLRNLIESGDWPPGHRLPSHAQLQEQYGVGRGVVEHAVAHLRREGLIEGVRRARPTVTYGPAVRTLLDPDADWPERRDAKRHDGHILTDDDLAARLNVAPRTRVARTAVELIDGAGVTVGLCVTWRRGRRRAHSSAECEVSMRPLAPVEAEFTGLATGTPVFVVQRTRFGPQGPQEASDLILPVDRWHLRAWSARPGRAFVDE